MYWFGRKGRIERRKTILGERYTSDLSTRKFYTEELKNLNTDLDFTEIAYIYQIGWCGGKKEYHEKILELIDRKEYSKIYNVRGVKYDQDGLGKYPVGDYIQTYIIQFRAGKTLIQLIKGTFEKDDQKKENLFVEEVEPIDIMALENRKLIYPI